MVVLVKIFFIRHGRTQSNKEGKMMGQTIDEPLSEEGIEQVKKMLPFLPRHFDVIISSPLRRTAQTAIIISEHRKVPIIYMEELKERNYGTLAGMKIEELPGLDKSTTDIDEQIKTVDFKAHGGESEEEMKKRLAKALDLIKSEYKGKTVLMVGSGGTLFYMHHVFPQEERKEIANASIHEFIFD